VSIEVNLRSVEVVVTLSPCLFGVVELLALLITRIALVLSVNNVMSLCGRVLIWDTRNMI
jgi:hypothetical protein